MEGSWDLVARLAVEGLLFAELITPIEVST